MSKLVLLRCICEWQYHPNEMYIFLFSFDWLRVWQAIRSRIRIISARYKCHSVRAQKRKLAKNTNKSYFSKSVNSVQDITSDSVSP